MNDNQNIVAEARNVRTLRELAKDQRGAGLVEYIILVGAVALASLGAYQGFSGAVNEKIQNFGEQVGGIGG